MGVNNLPTVVRSSTTAVDRTRDLLVASMTRYCCTVTNNVFTHWLTTMSCSIWSIKITSEIPEIPKWSWDKISVSVLADLASV